jgi:hypothetical protein
MNFSVNVGGIGAGNHDARIAEAAARARAAVFAARGGQAPAEALPIAAPMVPSAVDAETAGDAALPEETAP